jgi:hypothetical protein
LRPGVTLKRLFFIVAWAQIALWLRHEPLAIVGATHVRVLAGPYPPVVVIPLAFTIFYALDSFGGNAVLVMPVAVLIAVGVNTQPPVFCEGLYQVLDFGFGTAQLTSEIFL